MGLLAHARRSMGNQYAKNGGRSLPPAGRAAARRQPYAVMLTGGQDTPAFREFQSPVRNRRPSAKTCHR
ncbi:MAG TPA: hypothetical protein VFU41_01425 [Gemmatimonadales bacterium]|nr:hypothetical protein [Gemmatimonadales bacterium]